MLNRLRSFHADALDATGTIDALVRSGRPAIAVLSSARLRLMVTSRNRLTFLETDVYPALLKDRNDPAVMALRDDARQRMSDAAGHIARWNAPEIERHWDEYLQAAGRIRFHVRQRIQSEISVLYPLLSALDREQQARAA
ncbi:hypothetical protein [Sphingomonas montanisoli]|uniref:Uncharacterized protein n=1 Tax=Sphingomonas montanisoli TaxID=2606412 RepID=A0A5D9CE26_9SPHN|nr:hypothetical protein [Sphingomonas montanisoli]TZG29587.1 hypothetical protein FYJ91_05565 [Sphingomonas montanisoli]